MNKYIKLTLVKITKENNDLHIFRIIRKNDLASCGKDRVLRIQVRPYATIKLEKFYFESRDIDGPSLILRNYQFSQEVDND